MPITPAGSDRPAEGAIQHVHDDECAPDGASESLHPADADWALLADRIPRARRRERQREDQNRRKPPPLGCCPRGNCAGGRCGNARPKPAVGRRRRGYGSAPPVGATSRVGTTPTGWPLPPGLTPMQMSQITTPGPAAPGPAAVRRTEQPGSGRPDLQTKDKNQYSPTLESTAQPSVTPAGIATPRHVSARCAHLTKTGRDNSGHRLDGRPGIASIPGTAIRDRLTAIREKLDQDAVQAGAAVCVASNGAEGITDGNTYPLLPDGAVKRLGLLRLVDDYANPALHSPEMFNIVPAAGAMQ